MLTMNTKNKKFKKIPKYAEEISKNNVKELKTFVRTFSSSPPPPPPGPYDRDRLADVLDATH
jgi:hypothetical protein